MRTNLPIVAALGLLLFLFIYSCSSNDPRQDGMTEEKMEYRDYPKGAAQDSVQQ